MGMLYNAPFTGASWGTSAADVFELPFPNDCVGIIHAVTLFQTTELGDAAEEIVRLEFYKGYTSSGSGGSTVTPVPTEHGFSASGITSVECNNTTQATTSGTLMFTDGWNVRMPYLYCPVPEQRLVLSPSQRFVIARTAIVDAMTVSGCITWEEMGG